jgi:serine-threonine kinase receptor-associated protein
MLPDESFYIVSSCLDGKPMLRNGVTGDWIGTFVGHKGAVWCSRINSLGTQVATASADYSVKLWNAISGEEISSFVHSKVVKTVDFSKNGNTLITGSTDKYLRLYDIEKSQSDPTLWDSNSDSIKTVLWTTNESLVLSMCTKGVAQIWDIRSLQEVRKVEMKTPITHLSFSFDKKILTTIGNRQISFWNGTDFEHIQTHTIPPTIVAATIEHSDTPSIFITGGSDNWVRMYSFDDGREIEVLKGHHGPVNHVAFAPDTKTFGTASDDGTIRLWLTKEMSYGLWELGSDSSTLTNENEGKDSPLNSRRGGNGRWPPPSPASSTSPASGSGSLSTSAGKNSHFSKYTPPKGSHSRGVP